MNCPILPVCLTLVSLFVGAMDRASSAEKNVGWRGDGTGCYPTANPPTVWGRTSTTLKDITTQAQKPKGDTSGRKSVSDGVIRDWLILGPVPVPEGGKLATDIFPNEAELQPAENEKTGELTWKAISAETSCLDFNTIFGRKANVAAYAHTYIYSKAAHAIYLAGTYHGGLRCWLNGKEIANNDKPWCASAMLNLAAGWNSLLFKLLPDVAPDGGTLTQWYFSPQVFGRAPYEYENKNIAWICAMPGTGNAAPIVVGDKVFCTAETYDLVCVNRGDGKILWVNSANYFDTLSNDEIKANPALEKGVPWAERIRQINKAYSSSTPPDGKMTEEKHGLEQKLNELLLTVDKKKYRLLEGQDVGYAGISPVSDGKFVYVWYATGITVCYDLQGNRKWIHLDNDSSIREHGLATTPVLSGGKLIVHMNETLGLDTATGAVAWRLPRVVYQGSLTAVKIGDEALFIEPNCTVRRASDGKALFEGKGFGVINTPVVKDGVLYTLGQSFKLPATAAEPFKLEPYQPALTNVTRVDAGAIAADAFPHYYFTAATGSPLVNDGLMYSVDIDGVLSVIEIATGQVLYQKLLDANVINHHNMKAARGLGSSPTLAGKYVYIFGNQGAAVVLEAGRTFKQLAKNRIEHSVGVGQWWEHQETSVSCPVFDGTHLYYRGEDNLYCIGGN